MGKWMMVLVALAVAVAPVQAAGRTTDFDVSNHQVTNQLAGGKVEITEISKIEALTDGDIVSETVFFFPAAPEKIAAALAEPDQMCKLAAFCKGVTKTGATADGQGWTGEMTINADKVTRTLGAKSPWVREMKAVTQGHGEYKLPFELRQTQKDGATEIRFTLLKGKVFSKLEMTVRVLAGGPAATTVAITARTNSKLGSTLADRVTLAKRIVRDSAAVLDRAMTAQ
jgi:hypothetical protein